MAPPTSYTIGKTTFRLAPKYMTAGILEPAHSESDDVALGIALANNLKCACGGGVIAAYKPSGYGKVLACANGLAHKRLGTGGHFYLGIKPKPRGKPFGSTDHPHHNPNTTSTDKDTDMASLADLLGTPAPITAPTTTATQNHQRQTKVAASIDVATDTPAPKPVVTAPTGFQFPLDLAYKLADAARKALHLGTSGLTFGHRKLENWATLSALIFRKQLVKKPIEAVALAYHMTVVAREIEANRKMAIELFNASFGSHEVNSPIVPFTAVIDFAVTENIPLYLTGEPGVGKTYTLLDTLRRHGREPLRVQGSGELVKADVEGSMGYVEGQGTVWADGSLPIAMRTGRPFVFDELDKSRDDVLSLLAALLESHDGTLTLAATGERIFPAPGFGFFATGNTVGLGEGIQYEGTRVINEAIRDRFYFLTVNYMDEKVAKALVTAKLAAVGATV